MPELCFQKWVRGVASVAGVTILMCSVQPRLHVLMLMLHEVMLELLVTPKDVLTYDVKFVICITLGCAQHCMHSACCVSFVDIWAGVSLILSG